MPITDKSSKALLNFRTSSESGKQPTPTFPSFLPLEIFDNTEFDCRAPEEWIQLGEYIGNICLGEHSEVSSILQNYSHAKQ